METGTLDSLLIVKWMLDLQQFRSSIQSAVHVIGYVGAPTYPIRVVVEDRAWMMACLFHLVLPVPPVTTDSDLPFVDLDSTIPILLVGGTRRNSFLWLSCCI
jgi:hypothetical protein